MKMSTRKTIIINGEKVTASVGFLNMLSMWADEAAQSLKDKDLPSLANQAKDATDEIYNQLLAMGVYND